MTPAGIGIGEEDRQQYGALPYRLSWTGHIDILLITSRDTGRWIIPKGWPLSGEAGPDAAGRETFEEAGVVGAADVPAIGAYRYWKKRPQGAVICRVEVFSLRVADELDRWPDWRRRRRVWFTASDAAALVEEDELKALILRMPDIACADMHGTRNPTFASRTGTT
ncbi:MAG: NUDIX hydrolase [Parvibaculaceae bacterium]